MKTPEDLANEHWEWLEKLLIKFPRRFPELVPSLEYIYKTAFVHGYKHAKEERKETTNE